MPCSYFKSFINYVIDSPRLRYIGAANEGDAVAIAAGSELGGRPAIVLMQNSGLGNAVNPLTSLTETFRIPLLLIVTLRGEPGGKPDEPQHAWMGQIMFPGMLDLLGIGWEWFPAEDPRSNQRLFSPATDRITRRTPTTGSGHAARLGRRLAASRGRRFSPLARAARAPAAAQFKRTAMCRGASRPQAGRRRGGNDGYTSRELYAAADREDQFYMVGSMGCA